MSLSVIQAVRVDNKRADAIARRLSMADVKLATRVCNQVMFDLSQGKEPRVISITKDGKACVNVRDQLQAMGIDPNAPADELNRALLARKQSLRRAAKLLRASFYAVKGA
jgi:hypothetical protein